MLLKNQAIFLLLVIYALSLVSSEQINVVFSNQGNNVTLPCIGKPEDASVMWTYHGSYDKLHLDSEQTDGSLTLRFLDATDSGIYSCLFNDYLDDDNAIISKVNLTVRTHPHALVNVTVHPSTILAVILWNVGRDGGHPIIDFTAEYRAAAPINDSTGKLEDWKPISPNHISPNSRQIDVYHLVPNASYWFRVWGNNMLGHGPPVEVLAQTLYIDQEAELVRHFLTGMEEFDVRAWMAAVGVVMGTLLVLALGTCLMLCRDWRRHDADGTKCTSDRKERDST